MNGQNYMKSESISIIKSVIDILKNLMFEELHDENSGKAFIIHSTNILITVQIRLENNFLISINF
jgi:hypothetical protein